VGGGGQALHDRVYGYEWVMRGLRQATFLTTLFH